MDKIFFQKENVNRTSILVITLMIIMAFTTGCNPIVGEWVSGNEAFIFYNDGKFENFKAWRDQTPGGYVEGLGYGMSQPTGPWYWRLSKEGTYETDFNRDPAWIDLIFVSKGVATRKQGIIKIIDDDLFWLQFNNHNDTRPPSFNDREAIYRFSRAAYNEIGEMKKVVPE